MNSLVIVFHVYYEIFAVELCLESFAEYCVKDLVCPFGAAMCRRATQVRSTSFPEEYFQFYTEAKYTLDYMKKVLSQSNPKPVL